MLGIGNRESVIGNQKTEVGNRTNLELLYYLKIRFLYFDPDSRLPVPDCRLPIPGSGNYYPINVLLGAKLIKRCDIGLNYLLN